MLTVCPVNSLVGDSDIVVTEPWLNSEVCSYNFLTAANAYSDQIMVVGVGVF